MSFFGRAPHNPLAGDGIPFLLWRGDPPKNDNTKVTLGLVGDSRSEKSLKLRSKLCLKLRVPICGKVPVKNF